MPSWVPAGALDRGDGLGYPLPQLMIVGIAAAGFSRTPCHQGCLSSCKAPGKGLGQQKHQPARALHQPGGMPGTVTRLALIPQENAAVAIMINSGIVETYSPWDIERLC